MVGQDLQVHIRWMIRRDMRYVLDIEGLSFEHPWSEEDFLRCLRQRNCIGMVAENEAEHGNEALGFMIYELHKSHYRFLNLAVHPQFRRMKIGSQLVQKVVSKLVPAADGIAARRTSISIAVRETNLPAHLFFKQQGFEAARVLRRHYEDTGEDGYLMRYRMPDGHGVYAADDGPINRIARY